MKNCILKLLCLCSTSLYAIELEKTEIYKSKIEINKNNKLSKYSKLDSDSNLDLNLELDKLGIEKSPMQRNFETLSFLTHHENYFMLYYSFPTYKMYSPIFQPFDIKFQISLRIPIYLIDRHEGFFFGYTQRSWFQFANIRYSNPLRDTDYSPELFFFKEVDEDFLGGKIKKWTLGFLHLSNGIGGEKCYKEGFNKPNVSSLCFSRTAANRLLFSLMWTNNNFGINIFVWPYLPTRYDNPDLSSYIGYGNLKIHYKHKNNFFEFFLSPFIANFFNYKGSVRFNYSYTLNQYTALYFSYFFGYGDSLNEYNLKSHRFGIGIRIVNF